MHCTETFADRSEAYRSAAEPIGFGPPRPMTRLAVSFRPSFKRKHSGLLQSDLEAEMQGTSGAAQVECVSSRIRSWRSQEARLLSLRLSQMQARGSRLFTFPHRCSDGDISEHLPERHTVADCLGFLC